MVIFNEMFDSLYQVNVEVVIFFKQGEEIVKFDKYVFNSLLIKIWIDFIDFKCFVFEFGDYNFVVVVFDFNENDNVKEYNINFSIGFLEIEICQLGLILFFSYIKVEFG